MLSLDYFVQNRVFVLFAPASVDIETLESVALPTGYSFSSFYLGEVRRLPPGTTEEPDVEE